MLDTELTLTGEPRTLADRFATWRVRTTLRLYKGVVWLRQQLRHVSMKRVIALLLLVSVAAFALMIQYAVEYSGFAAPVIRATCGITLFYIIDKQGFNEVSTIDHIRDDPRAYADHLRSYALVVAAAFVSAFGAG